MTDRPLFYLALICMIIGLFIKASSLVESMFSYIIFNLFSLVK